MLLVGMYLRVFSQYFFTLQQSPRLHRMPGTAASHVREGQIRVDVPLRSGGA